MTAPGRTPLLALVVLLALGSTAVPAQDEPPSKDDPVAEARSLIETIERQRVEIGRLRERIQGEQGETEVLGERRLLRLGLRALANVDALVANVARQETDGLDATEFRAAAEEIVGGLVPLTRRRIADLEARIADLRARRANASGTELIDIEGRLRATTDKLNAILGAALTNAENMQALGLSAAGQEQAELGQVLSDLAETRAEGLRLALERISVLRGRLTEAPEDSDLKTVLRTAELDKTWNRGDLQAAIGMMSRLELDTADHQKLLIQATGQITTDILDAKVAFGLFQRWLLSLKDWAFDTGPRLAFNVVVFLFILFVFRTLAKLTRKIVRRAASASKLELSQLMQKMFVSISGNVVMIIGLLVALSQLGFALGPVLAGLGIVGFVLGFALQETLGNFAAGTMILIYRPFDVGDMVEAAGVFGKVSAMSMVSTTILTIDNQTLVVPNGKIWGDVIKNVTAQTERRVDMTFGISYADDIPHAETVLTKILEEHPAVLKDPEPVIKLHKLGDSSVDFVVRPWVKTDDYWDVYWDVTREVKMSFDREGISIPFPQRDVHYYEEKRISGSA